MSQSTVLQTTGRPGAGTSSGGTHSRRDIQGLRAVAVVAVVLDHVLAWPSGGFVGVDVFFVVSGFLITGLLLREWERSGRISLLDFSARRIKRIVPAAIVVLLATLAAAAALYGSRQFESVAVDSLFAFLVTANWRFAAIGTDYFRSGDAVSPLQHFWSLSVEEQYYLVWPGLMLLVLWLTVSVARRPASAARTAVGVVIGLLTVASFAWAMTESTANPTVAYFSTLSRAWELGAGAILAVLAGRLAHLPAAVRPVLAWTGLAGIGVSFALIDDELPFPAPWALLPVLSTVLVLAANSGTRSQATHLLPLTNRVSTFLGDISYSLYLWHFPAVVFAGSFFPAGSPLLVASSLIAALVLSIASYHLIEQPAQASPLLAGGRRRERRQAWHTWWGVFGPRLRIGAVAALAVATIVPVSIALTPPPPPPAGAAPGPLTPTASAASESPAAPVTAATELTGRIEQALASTTFPEFDPPIADLSTEALFSSVTTPDCLDITTTQQSIDCESGPTDTGLDVVVLGDSFAIAWSPGIKAALEPLGYRIHPLTRGECPASFVSVTHGTGAAYPECDEIHEWRQERVAEIAPELTILAQSHGTILRMTSPGSPAEHAEELAAGLRRTVDGISSSSDRMIVLSSPPEGKQMRECATAFASPADCVTSPSREFATTIAAEKRALEGSPAEHVDTLGWFCAHQRCPGFVGTTPVHADSSHLTIQYSTMLADVIAEAVTSAPTP
ncbi:acyltransferase [Rathayibacter sp. VKM Ac-2835]|uniref:acyltransferase family protein n=1 Tax=Rathayibacter sp. VKM Ac-2835 TaxID=2739043 RepID=UPI001565385D|nr:acyltransferase family protein [Rathayibacter sp. VKM Ac-2835]NRG39629.1 acyltransferase [Rathayibacter sp. VKM Ac-2835]